MIPLWTSTNSPEASVWGWALTSFGTPWVAQRVCPIPDLPGDRLSLEQIVQTLHLSGRLAHLDPAIGRDCDTCRVISSILESPQRRNEHVLGVARADVADYATHGSLLCFDEETGKELRFPPGIPPTSVWPLSPGSPPGFAPHRYDRGQPRGHPPNLDTPSSSSPSPP